MKAYLIIFVGIILINSGCLVDSKNQNQECTAIYLQYDKPPVLKSGYEEDIEKRLQYPETARMAGIEGRVYLTYEVNKTGKVIGTSITRSLFGECDREAQRLVSTAKFTPAKRNGRRVCAKDTMHVTFKLSMASVRQ